MAKKTKEQAGKVGRPKAKIEWKKVDQLLKAGCTGASIAEMIGIHPDTLYERCKEEHKTNFSDYSQQKRAVGLDMLKAKQFDIAMKGNQTMLIWLGKQYLDQKDKVDESVSVKARIEDIRGIVVK